MTTESDFFSNEFPEFERVIPSGDVVCANINPSDA
jgi:hypothetical protein